MPIDCIPHDVYKKKSVCMFTHLRIWRYLVVPVDMINTKDCCGKANIKAHAHLIQTNTPRIEKKESID